MKENRNLGMLSDASLVEVQREIMLEKDRVIEQLQGELAKAWIRYNDLVAKIPYIVTCRGSYRGEL